MSSTCEIGIDVDRLRTEIRSTYTDVARAPDGEFHFHRGPRYAAEWLRYDAAELATLPSRSTASFAGVGNPHRIAPLERGQTVLDIGCGAGMDLLLAARAVGPEGKAIGVEMTEAMAESAEASIAELGLSQAEVRLGDAIELPLPSASVDVVISNGVLNLVADKPRAFAEIARVLKPGGRLQLADITVTETLSDAIRNDIDLWTS